jgi:hypothetical protein
MRASAVNGGSYFIPMKISSRTIDLNAKYIQIISGVGKKIRIKNYPQSIMTQNYPRMMY